MRFLLLLAALAFAGCFASSEPPAASTGAGVSFSTTHDFSKEPAVARFPVETSATLQVSITLNHCAPQPGDVAVVVRDATGVEVARAEPTIGSNVQVGVGGDCKKTVGESAAGAAGEWSVHFEGRGVGTASVSIVG